MSAAASKLFQRVEPDEPPRLDRSTALGARSTALGARSTALGTALTAPRAELTAPRDESTAPPSGGVSVLLRPSVVWASASPDSARTSAAVVVIVLTEFIGLDLLVAAHHGQPGASDSVPMVLGGGGEIHPRSETRPREGETRNGRRDRARSSDRRDRLDPDWHAARRTGAVRFEARAGYDVRAAGEWRRR
jgi:hypothetical protein